MKNKQDNTRHEDSSHEQSIRKPYEDLNVPEFDPYNDIMFLGDEEDEFSDYSLMNLDQDQDYYL
ncbi:MAG: hypothetical protein K0B08_01395 [Bacteroidales bacterium]|nr:hypothetical protein [Bacteroidales bacterium]